MTDVAAINSSDRHSTFGSYLRFLRRRARLTQRELAVAVNYSEGQICHLERGRRVPDLATLAALFVPALHLEDAPEESARLLALAAGHHTVARQSSAAAMRPAGVIELPAPATPLIGRSYERAQIRALLTQGAARLVTLVGPPGVGKTRLALQAIEDLAGDFPDGAHFIDLAAVDDPDMLASAIARVLEVDEATNLAPLATIQQALSRRRALLALDNFEQVVAAAPLLTRLLAAAPGVGLIVTSRVALRLRIEQILHVQPLPIPDLSRLPPPAELARIESVALLLARLRAVRPEFELTSANALPLAAICVRVDGLPLAIELVAARGRLLGPQELLTEVAQRFLQLRQRGRDIPARLQTITAALTWSYEQISVEARRLLMRLSVFVGRWSLDLVEPVCDPEGIGRAALLDILDELLEHSLLQRHAGDQGDTALGMLAMVREYAQERLRESGEVETLHGRLLAATIERAEYAQEQLVFGAEQALWLARLALEYDTFRAALGWALGAQRHAEGLRLAAALWRFWYMRGMLSEGRRWLEEYLALPVTVSPAIRAHALDGVGILAWRQGEYDQAEIWLQAALDLYRGERRQDGEARVLSHLGLVATERGAYAQALASYEAILPLYRSLGDSAGVASVLHNLGNLHCHQNNHTRALELYTECLAIYEECGSQVDIALVSLGIGAVARDLGDSAAAEAAFSRTLTLAELLSDEWTAATALLNLGDIASDRGNRAAAQAHFAAALAIFERLGDQQQMAVVQARQARTTFLEGDRAASLRLYRQSLMLSSAIGFQPGIAESLEGIAINQAQPLVAARLFAAAAAVRSAYAIPISIAEQQQHEYAIRRAQRGVDAGQWVIAWAEGERLPQAQAVAMALTRGHAGELP